MPGAALAGQRPRHRERPLAARRFVVPDADTLQGRGGRGPSGGSDRDRRVAEHLDRVVAGEDTTQVVLLGGADHQQVRVVVRGEPMQAAADRAVVVRSA